MLFEYRIQQRHAVTCTDLARQLKEQELTANAPLHLVFRKTFAFWTALRNIGCSAVLDDTAEPTPYFGREKEVRDVLLNTQARIRRGHNLRRRMCDGRLLLQYHGRVE